MPDPSNTVALHDLRAALALIERAIQALSAAPEPTHPKRPPTIGGDRRPEPEAEHA